MNASITDKERIRDLEREVVSLSRANTDLVIVNQQLMLRLVSANKLVNDLLSEWRPDYQEEKE